MPEGDTRIERMKREGREYGERMRIHGNQLVAHSLESIMYEFERGIFGETGVLDDRPKGHRFDTVLMKKDPSMQRINDLWNRFHNIRGELKLFADLDQVVFNENFIDRVDSVKAFFNGEGNANGFVTCFNIYNQTKRPHVKPENLMNECISKMDQKTEILSLSSHHDAHIESICKHVIHELGI
jgi:hypothetical protein